MAKMTLTNGYLSVDGTDLSNRVRSMTLNYEAEMLDASTMGTGSTRSMVAGFKNWSLDVEFTQDFAASNVDATLFPLVGDTTGFTVAVKPVNTTTSATNPQYSGTATLATYQPVAGTVGEVLVVSCRFVPTGDDAVLSRATS